MEKHDGFLTAVAAPTKRNKGRLWSKITWTAVIVLAVIVASISWYQRKALQRYWPSLPASGNAVNEVKVVRYYNLTIGYKWANQDGGRWRTVFVCNGETPCPILTAQEGDDVQIHIVNDLPAQLSIHCTGFWNDGTGGLNQYPILPRGNWTSRFDTTGHFGLNWYADHSGAGVVDGVYGMIYTAPSKSRERPYSRITKSKSDLRLIEEAEGNIRHISLWNSDFRTVAWKLDRMKATGKSMSSCYKSILVNGKGRVFCRNPKYSTLDGYELDAAGCIVPPGQQGDACTPSDHDFEVIETNGQKYVMLNLLNVGFEHAVKVSIDDHKIWIVSNDAGFVEPQLVDTVYITNGARLTVLVEMDQPARDYAIRIASTSTLQNLESYALLRYPASRYPMLGAPMELPETDERTKICLNPDSSVPDGCTEMAHDSLRSFPRKEVPKNPNLTLLWTAGEKQNEYLPTVKDYFVNEKPWQLFRAAMKPVLFMENIDNVEKPIQNGLPLGTVVDLIVQNTINDTIPMYKHGDPTFRLGSKAHSTFNWSSIREALQADKDVVNVDRPPLGIVHDLPPLGWLALRWKVDVRGATMLHAVKFRYFALGMAAPLLEGIEHSMLPEIPEYAQQQPHVEFVPANDGALG